MGDEAGADRRDGPLRRPVSACGPGAQGGWPPGHWFSLSLARTGTHAPCSPISGGVRPMRPVTAYPGAMMPPYPGAAMLSQQYAAAGLQMPVPGMPLPQPGVPVSYAMLPPHLQQQLSQQHLQQHPQQQQQHNALLAAQLAVLAQRKRQLDQASQPPAKQQQLGAPHGVIPQQVCCFKGVTCLACGCAAPGS